MPYGFEHYRKHDPNFVADLERSEMHVARVALWLTDRGYTVQTRPVRVRPTEEDMASYADSGDLDLLVDNEWQRIEVKQRRLEFTGVSDFPYPSIIVDVAHTWDRADPKPHAYVLTNREVTVCVIIDGSTSDQWLRVSKHDRFKNRDRVFYECPIRLGRFFAMDDRPTAPPRPPL